MELMEVRAGQPFEMIASRYAQIIYRGLRLVNYDHR
jgi:hypothetical protein